jgi:hypothetical protein
MGRQQWDEAAGEEEEVGAAGAGVAGDVVSRGGMMREECRVPTELTAAGAAVGATAIEVQEVVTEAGEKQALPVEEPGGPSATRKAGRRSFASK